MPSAKSYAQGGVGWCSCTKGFSRSLGLVSASSTLMKVHRSPITKKLKTMKNRNNKPMARKVIFNHKPKSPNFWKHSEVAGRRNGQDIIVCFTGKRWSLRKITKYLALFAILFSLTLSSPAFAANGPVNNLDAQVAGTNFVITISNTQPGNLFLIKRAGS